MPPARVPRWLPQPNGDLIVRDLPCACPIDETAIEMRHAPHLSGGGLTVHRGFTHHGFPQKAPCGESAGVVKVTLSRPARPTVTVLVHGMHWRNLQVMLDGHRSGDPGYLYDALLDPDAWAGNTDPARRKYLLNWASDGISYADASPWLVLPEFDPGHRDTWQSHGFDHLTGPGWLTQFTIHEAPRAAAYRNAGLTPAQSSLWRRVGEFCPPVIAVCIEHAWDPGPARRAARQIERAAKLTGGMSFGAWNIDGGALTDGDHALLAMVRHGLDAETAVLCVAAGLTDAEIAETVSANRLTPADLDALRSLAALRHVST